MNVSSIVVDGSGAKLTCCCESTVAIMGAGGVAGTTLRGGATVGARSTLRDGASVVSVMAASRVLTGVGAAMDVRTLVSCQRAAVWLSVRGARGEPGDGCKRA
jgi:hypothetical protein